MKLGQTQEKSLLKVLATPLALSLLIGWGVFSGAATIALPVYLLAAHVAAAHAQDTNTPRVQTTALGFSPHGITDRTALFDLEEKDDERNH